MPRIPEFATTIREARKIDKKLKNLKPEGLSLARNRRILEKFKELKSEKNHLSKQIGKEVREASIKVFKSKSDIRLANNWPLLKKVDGAHNKDYVRSIFDKSLVTTFTQGSKLRIF